MDTGKSGGGQRRMETTTDLVLKLPAPPQKPIASSPVLITEEEDVFARCEVATENLKVAFWAAVRHWRYQGRPLVPSGAHVFR